MTAALLLGLGLAGCAPHNGPAPAPDSAAGNNAGVLNVADAAIAGNDPAMALKISQSVLASDPDNLQALYHEAAAYFAVGRCQDAVAAYKVALELDPKSSVAETGIGRCLLRRNAAEAEQAFAAAVQDDPRNAAALSDLGVARDLQGNFAGATQPLQQALLIDPGEPATEVDLGLSLAFSGDGPDALQYLGPLATASDATPKIRADYAAALVASGRPDEARQVLAEDLPPDQVEQLISAFSGIIANAAAVAAAPPAASAPLAPLAQAALMAPPLAVVKPAAITPPATPAADSAPSDEVLR